MNLVDAACSQVWAMREAELERLMTILQRESLDPDLARQIRDDRAERLALTARPAPRLDGARAAQLRDGIALIDITGPIVRRADMFSDISGATSTQSIMHDLTVAMQSASVDAVLLVVDSPGGEVTGLTEAAQYIRAARQQKPIWAYIEGNGASAAYWLSSATGRVIAGETADVGWIGIVAPMRDPTKVKSDKIEFVSSKTPRKRPDITTEAGRTQMQESVDAVADVFFADVAAGRDVSLETVINDFGQGGGMIGKAAVSAGLADATGTFESTLAALRQEVARRRQPARMAACQEDDMKFSEMVASIFRGAKDAGIEIESDAPDVVAAASTMPVPPDPAITASLDELRKQLGEQQAQARQAQAAAFADGAVRAHQAMPSERQALYDAYIQASEDDAARPLERTRVSQIEAMVSSRTPHDLIGEAMPVTAGGALDATASTSSATMSEERRRALLASTPLGQSTLTRRQRTPAA